MVFGKRRGTAQFQGKGAGRRDSGRDAAYIREWKLRLKNIRKYAELGGKSILFFKIHSSRMNKGGEKH